MGILRLHGFIPKTGMGWWPSPNMDLSWIYLIHPKFEDVFFLGSCWPITLYWLVVLINHLEQYNSQLGRIIPNILWKNKIHVPNHQPVIFVWGLHHFQTHPIDIFSWFQLCIQWYVPLHMISPHDIPHVLPSGKQPHNYGKSPFLMGKLTINGHFQ